MLTTLKTKKIKIKKKEKNLNITLFSPELNRLLTIIYLAYLTNKKILFYFDVSIIQDIRVKKNYELFLHDIFKIFPNIIFITKYMPGFISNSKNEYFKGKIENFVLFVFLNFTYENVQHRILVGEIKKYLYEIVLITNDNRDINFDRIVPYSYIKLNLNFQNQFDFFYLALSRFLFRIKRIPENRLYSINVSINIENLCLVSIFYTLKVLRNKKIFLYLKKRQQTGIKNIESFINLILDTNKIQKYFYKKYLNLRIINFIKKYLSLFNQKIFILSKKRLGFGIVIKDITERILQQNDTYKV
jgi:hypothetical protein